jgi:hypothetical protein
MLKSFLILLLERFEGLFSKNTKENIVRNVFLYPSFLFLFQLPLLIQKHWFFSIVLGGIALASLIGYFIALKHRLFCQMEYPLMLLLSCAATLLSYISFFIHDEIYNYSFILSSTVGMLIVMNIFMIFTGNTQKLLKHYIERKHLSAYNPSDLKVLDEIMLYEYIIVRHIFTGFKDLYKSYLPSSGLYIGIDFGIDFNVREANDYCRIADNYELNKSYSLLELIRYIQENDINVAEFSKDDFDVFLMNRY